MVGYVNCKDGDEEKSNNQDKFAILMRFTIALSRIRSKATLAKKNNSPEYASFIDQEATIADEMIEFIKTQTTFDIAKNNANGRSIKQYQKGIRSSNGYSDRKFSRDNAHSKNIKNHKANHEKDHEANHKTNHKKDHKADHEQDSEDEDFKKRYAFVTNPEQRALLKQALLKQASRRQK